VSIVVVTGARGYIARALARLLANKGYSLRLVSRVQNDLCDEESWHTLLRGADAVVHLSSRTDLQAAETNPTEDRIFNVEPVRVLARAAERCGRAVPVIFASSTSIAGTAHSNPVNEQTLDRPCSVYDRHKLECETILQEATKRRVLRACSLRLATVYGYGNGIGSVNPNRGVLNTMMYRAVNGQPLTLYGDGSPIRDFTHVNDVCNAFHLALAKQAVCDGGHYIVATGRGHTLAEAFRFIKQEAQRLIGRDIEIRHIAEPAHLHPIERSNFVGDASAFQRLTAWRADIDLRSGIRDCLQQLVANAAIAGAG